MLWLCFAFNKDSFCHAHALNGEKKVSRIIRAKCKFRISRWQTTTLKLVGWFLVGRLVCLFVCLCVCLLYNTLSFSLQRKAKRYITYIIYHMKTVKAKVKYCQLQGSGELSCRTLEHFASTVQIWQLESMTRSPITCT